MIAGLTPTLVRSGIADFRFQKRPIWSMMDRGDSRFVSGCHEDQGRFMAIHHWVLRVEAGYFIISIRRGFMPTARALNAGILPADYYALGEQHAAGFEPDALTLHAGEARR